MVVVGGPARRPWRGRSLRGQNIYNVRSKEHRVSLHYGVFSSLLITRCLSDTSLLVIEMSGVQYFSAIFDCPLSTSVHQCPVSSVHYNTLFAVAGLRYRGAQGEQGPVKGKSDHRVRDLL